MTSAGTGSRRRAGRTLAAAGAAVAAVALVVGAWALWWRSPAAVVVYCAHDAVFAEQVLRDFTARTGIAVAVRYDTEATKSLGLVERLAREADAPACDVFWNNELLGTLDLAERGVLAPYRGDGWSRMPAAFRDADGRWTGFAARLRVLIAYRAEAPADAPAQHALLAGALDRFAIAKPLYGTTLTHYTVLWDRFGADAAKAWHGSLRERGAREVDGNGAVKDLVASGACTLGWTDTDDAFAARDAGAPVTFAPVRLDDGATIVIPNTVALVRGAPHGESARRLVDFLLSAETEVALARSASRQVPLGPVDESELPSEVRALRSPAARGVPLAGMLAARNGCLAWLKSEYAR